MVGSSVRLNTHFISLGWSIRGPSDYAIAIITIYLTLVLVLLGDRENRLWLLRSSFLLDITSEAVDPGVAEQQAVQLATGSKF